MSKRSAMLQNTLLLSAANLAMRGVSILFQIYLTDQVGAAGIGLLQLIMTINAFAVTVGTSGIRVAAMYLSAEEYGRRRPEGIRQAMLWCLGAGTGLSILVGSAMALGAQPLSVYWVKDLRAAAAIRLLGLALPLTCLSTILAGYFTACGKIRRLVTVEIGDRIITVLLTIMLLRPGVKGDLSHACVSIAGGGALGSACSVAVLLIMMLADFRSMKAASGSAAMGKRLVCFCVPVALNDYLRAGLGTLEQFLIPHGLSRSGGSRTQALADYGTIHGMVFPVMMLPSTVLYAVADLLVPKLARSRAEGNCARTGRITSDCLRAGILFAGTIAGLLFILAEPLGNLLYGSADAGRYLRLFTPLIPMLYLDCIVDGMHKGLGQQLYCVRVNTLTNFLDVLLLFLLLPRYGIGGYFFTYTFTHAINFYLSLRRLIVLTDLVPDWRFLTAAGFSVCASAAALSLLLPAADRWSSVFLCGGLYLILQCLLMNATGCIDRRTNAG